MVAPLIVGAARVAAGTSRANKARKVARNTRKAFQSGKASNKAGTYAKTAYRASKINNLHQKEREGVTGARRRIGVARKLLKHGNKFNSSAFRDTSQEIETSIKTVRAISAGWMVVGFTAPFLVFNFFVWMLGLSGVGLMAAPIINILPVDMIFYFAFYYLVMANLLMIIYAFIVFKMRKVDCIGGYKSLVLIVCIAGSLMAFINIVPFAYLWVLAVVKMQNEEQENNTQEE